MQNITRKAVRPSDSEEHVKFRSIQADEYKSTEFLLFELFGGGGDGGFFLSRNHEILNVYDCDCAARRIAK
jgi:hypothetical protein